MNERDSADTAAAVYLYEQELVSRAVQLYKLTTDQ